MENVLVVFFLRFHKTSLLVLPILKIEIYCYSKIENKISEFSPIKSVRDVETGYRVRLNIRKRKFNFEWNSLVLYALFSELV